MARTIVISVIVLLAVLITAGCMGRVVIGSGKVVTQPVAVSEFSSVKLNGIGDAIITHGGKEALTIEAEDNLIPYFDIAVVGNTLTISHKPENEPYMLRPTRPVRFNITVKDLQGLALNGSGNIVVTDNSQAANFSVSDSGSGNISVKDVTASSLDMALTGSGNTQFGQVSVKDAAVSSKGSGNIAFQGLKATTVNVRGTGSGNITLASLSADSMIAAISGSGRFNAAGTLTDQQVQILGSGDYRGSNLQSKRAAVRISGSGSSSLWVTDALEANLSGSGSVTYAGKPSVTVNRSGSGSVKQVYVP
jgi:hypothetical protein